jgi:tetratricopeptide (TPR) repeat protein
MTARATPRCRLASIEATRFIVDMPGRRRRHVRAAGVALVAFAILVVTPRQGWAQSGSAEALFNEGYQLLNAGKLEQACETFEASNRAQPGAGTYLALGMCRENNRQLASAWSAYQAALARARDVEKRGFARTKITELEPRLSHLMVSVSADSRAAGLTLTRNGIPLDPLLWNRALPTDGGDYVIEARAPGREPWRTTVHVPIERGEITVAMPDIAKQSGRAPTPAPAPRPEAGWTTKQKVAVGSAVASVVAAAAGVAFGLRARSDHDQAFDLCPMAPPYACDRADQANQLSRSAHNLALGADLAFGIAGATAIVAGTLWLTGGRDSSRGVAIVPTASPGLFAVTATRWF